VRCDPALNVSLRLSIKFVLRYSHLSFNLRLFVKTLMPTSPHKINQVRQTRLHGTYGFFANAITALLVGTNNATPAPPVASSEKSWLIVVSLAYV
jgi:hypothetical protein